MRTTQKGDDLKRQKLPYEDREGIHEVIYRYAWCLDTNDADGIAEIFTADGVLVSARRTYNSRDEMKTFLDDVHADPGREGRQHHIQPVNVERAGDGYVVTSYWLAVTRRAGEAPVVFATGYYVDTVVKVNGDWLLKEKQIKSWDNETAPLARPSGHGRPS